MLAYLSIFICVVLLFLLRWSCNVFLYHTRAKDDSSEDAQQWRM